MKKIISLLIAIVIIFNIVGCGKKTNIDKQDGNYSGKVTALSKKYVSKGYAINIYRSVTPLGDDADSLGKAYITMGFNILSEYTSTVSYNPNADYNIKKVVVTNVKLLSTSKKGIVEDLIIMKRYSQFIGDPHVDVIDNKTKYEIINETPNSSGVQSQIMVNLNKIALYDEAKYPLGSQPTINEIYNNLGITRDSVALKVGFRVELTTVSNKILYKDYEIAVPPVGIDIAGSEYHFEFYENDINKMAPFLEKD